MTKTSAISTRRRHCAATCRPSHHGAVVFNATRRLMRIALSRTALTMGLATIALSAIVTSSTHSQDTAPSVPVPPHDTFTVMSKSIGEARKINVYTPKEYTGRVRLPVLYMPDGGVDEDFPHIVHTVDSLVKVRAIRPVIIVGIPNTMRRRDLTGPTRIKSDSAISPQVGGSQQFRSFLSDELIPVVEKRYRTTGERSIIGESLAGLFIVETFLMKPDLFTHYVALDASTWWNAGALIEAAPAYLKAFNAKPRTLYLAISDIEEKGGGVTNLDKLLHANPPKGLRWSYLQRLDLVHSTIFRALEGPALASALK